MIRDKIKKALRINHDMLNDTIDDTVSAARAEMIRAGIAQTKAADDTNALIVQAITTYCLYNMASVSDTQREKLNDSWLYQIDCLRKTDSFAE